MNRRFIRPQQSLEGIERRMQVLLEALKEFQFLATGLFAVLAAAIGFGGVWYAQNRIAANAREDRDHGERIAREERDHREALVGRDIEQEVKNRRASLIHAISGELSALHPLVGNLIQLASILSAIYEKLDEAIEDQPMPNQLLLYSFKTPIYGNHIRDIGLLPPSLTYSVVRVYTRLNAESITTKTDDNPMKVPVGVIAILARTAKDSYIELQKDVHDTVMRLHAVRLGYDDPGPGKGGQFAEVYLPNTNDKIAQTDMQDDTL